MDITPMAKGSPGRRGKSRRQGERSELDRRADTDRRTSSVKRMVVDFFHTLRMPKIADVVKTTKLIEPAVTVMTLILSGLVNAQTMGWGAGLGLLTALSFHEYGHYRAAKREGYRPEPWWFIPLLGAIMRLPQITARIHEAKIAYGGPFIGLLFTIATTLIWLVFAFLPRLPTIVVVENFLLTTALISVVLNVFNLIPISPLDGGRITQAMNGVWPKLMRVVGFIALLSLTAWMGQATMLVVWILVIGQLRLSKLWRVVVAVALLMLMFSKLGHDVFVTHVISSPWRIGGELAYSLVGAYFVREYIVQWRKPHRYVPRNDFRKQQVGRRDGEMIRDRYFGLLASFGGMFILLVYLSDRLG